MGAQGVLYAVWAASVSMFLGPRFGLSSVGVVTGASACGRVASLFLEKNSFLASHKVRTSLAVTSCIALSLVCRFASWQIVTLTIIVGDTLFGLYNSSATYIAKDRMPLGSAASMVTQAAGLTMFGSIVLISADMLSVALVAAALLCLPSSALNTISIGSTDSKDHETRSLAPLAVTLALSVTSYAPLVIFSTILSLRFSPQLVGPAYLSYALGSVAAVANKRATSAGLLESFSLASLGSAVWLLGLVSGPYVIVARFVSGFLMFSAQSAVLSFLGRKYGKNGLAKSLVGVLVGAQLSAFWAGPIASKSVPAMSAISAIGALLVGLLAHYALKRNLSTLVSRESAASPSEQLDNY